MANVSTQSDLSLAMTAVIQAVDDHKLKDSSRQSILKWLNEPAYARYRPELLKHITEHRWQQLDDVFWSVIPFGTGGRRGRMYPIGTYAINDRTIGESAAGLAQYVREWSGDGGDLACAIAYDTRHKSRHFAELCARIMVAANFTVYFLDDYRSTPQLSFLVRHKRCSCGIMVTASHNPPSDNAVKIYWSTGGQVLPPHDAAIIHQVMDNVAEIDEGDTFQKIVESGQVEICTAEIDRVFIEAVVTQRCDGPRDLKIIYSPLHGVGVSAVLPALQADGFSDVELFAEHADPDGSFPNVPDHVANPENMAVFDDIIARAKATGAELIMATDPDCDRLGCAAPLTTRPDADWETLNGNQIGVLLTDFLLEQRGSSLTSQNYLVTTLVTTEMIRRIGDSYGVATHRDLLVGFKWIGGEIDHAGANDFVFGAEESHGYLAGQHARDKDGAVAAMLLAELAAQLKAAGQTLHEKLDALYWQHGYHGEQLVTIKMEGAEGMVAMQRLMERFRQQPPGEIAGLAVHGVRDYLNGSTRFRDGSVAELDGPQGDLVILDLELAGNCIAARPSGTEPKIKFYLFTYVPAEQLADLETSKQEMSQRLDQMHTALQAFAKME